MIYLILGLIIGLVLLRHKGLQNDTEWLEKGFILGFWITCWGLVLFGFIITVIMYSIAFLCTKQSKNFIEYMVDAYKDSGIIDKWMNY